MVVASRRIAHSSQRIGLSARRPDTTEAKEPVVTRVGEAFRARLSTGGTATGIGSLPHRDTNDAMVAASVAAPGITYIPTLPRLSPTEGMIAQAVIGIPGISVGQYGSMLIDPRGIDPDAPVSTDLSHGPFAGFRSYIAGCTDQVAAHDGADVVKWQFVGPVTLGLALVRSGVPAETAFPVASAAVRTHVANLHTAISRVAPDTTQIIFIDEPDLASLMSASFPVSPETAIDLMSTAMAVVEGRAIVGVHCCAAIDIVPLMASGPAILSVPVSAHLGSHAGAISDFLERDGIIAWGVVPTDGPVMATAERSWRRLSKLWCELVESGCDVVKLWRQSMVTPACGLAHHTATTSEIIMSQVREISERIRTHVAATRLTVGA